MKLFLQKQFFTTLQKCKKVIMGSILVAKDDRLVGVITDRDLALQCVKNPITQRKQQLQTGHDKRNSVLSRC